MKTISVVILLLISITPDVSTVRIGSFNLQQYGPKKAGDLWVTNKVATIINDFDIAVIQEISGSNMTVPHILHAALDEKSRYGPYRMTSSQPVGRSNPQEQYIFFNRESTSGVQLVHAYLYNDLNNYFQRPPFIGTFKVFKPASSGIEYFTIINVHLKPMVAYQESIKLRYVIQDFILNYPQYFFVTSRLYKKILAENVIDATPYNRPSLKTNHPILIMGDFNADSTYINNDEQESLRSIYFADFVWMINNQVKTNIKQTCTYDRILINGDKFVQRIVRDSNTTVNFQHKFHLNDKETERISDHFPVKFDIIW